MKRWWHLLAAALVVVAVVLPVSLIGARSAPPPIRILEFTLPERGWGCGGYFESTCNATENSIALGGYVWFNMGFESAIGRIASPDPALLTKSPRMGQQAQYRIAVFDLPFPKDDGVSDHPHALGAGADGNLWFTESHNFGTGSDYHSNPIAQLNIASLPQQSAAPAGSPLPATAPWMVNQMVDPALYYIPCDNPFDGKVLPQDTSLNNGKGVTCEKHTYAITPTPDRFGFNWVTLPAFGSFVSSTLPGTVGGATIARVCTSASGCTVNGTSYATGHIDEFPVQDFADTNGWSPVKPVVGPDGRIWFDYVTADTVGHIGSFDPANPPTLADYKDPNVVWRFDLPVTATSNAAAKGSSPDHIAFGPDNQLYIAATGSDNIVRFDPRSKTFTGVFNVPTQGTFLGEIVTGPDNNMWFTEGGRCAAPVHQCTTTTLAKVAQLVPSTGAITEWDVPSQDSDPYGISVDSHGIWFNEFGGWPGYRGAGGCGPETNPCVRAAIGFIPFVNGAPLPKVPPS